MDSLYAIITDILRESKRNASIKKNQTLPKCEQTVPTNEELEVKVGEVISFAKPVLLHVIGVFTAYQCQRSLKDFITADDSSAQKFRLKLSGMSYIHLNLKFFMLNILKLGVSDSNVQKWMKDFNIALQDAKLLVKVYKSYGFKTVAKKAVVGLKVSDIDGHAFKHVNDTFMEIYPEIYKHIRNRTYKKLRFMSMSCNIEFHDFNMDLMLKSLQTYNKMVPTNKSPLHVANYIRNSINNHVTNMIKSGTAQKRARMVQGAADGFGGNKFEILTVSENQLQHALGLEDTISYENLRDTASNVEEEHRNLSDLNYERILRKFGTTRKRRVLIELISCCEDAAFTKWLRKNNLIKDHEDNVDFNTKIGSKLYLRNVCEYLNVCNKKAIKFIKLIGTQAYPDRV